MRKIPEWVEEEIWRQMVVPVIIKVKPEKIADTIEYIKSLFPDFISDKIDTVITKVSELSKLIIKLDLFNMIALPVPRELVWELETYDFIEKIYYDFDVYAIESEERIRMITPEVPEAPTVPKDGIYEFTIGKYKVRGTTTYWTKKILGAERANQLGYKGYGVRVAVCDTGCFRLPGLEKVKIRSVLHGVDYDVVQGHGCIMPGTRIALVNPGLIKIEDFYDSVKTEEFTSNVGISKEVDKDIYVYTISEEGKLVKDKVKYVHKLWYDGEVIKIRPVSVPELVLTPWHPVMIYDVDKNKFIYKRADNVKVGDSLVYSPKFSNIIRKDKDYILLKIIEVTKEKYSGWMYDLTTEKYNTYIADGYVAHNTWCCSCVVSRHVIDERGSKKIGRPLPVEGLAPGCDCYSVRVLGHLGSGKASWIIKGFQDALMKYNCEIINASLGAKLNPKVVEPDDDPFYHVTKIIYDLDRILCVASGNFGKGILCSPGSLPTVLRVGAYDPVTGRVAPFTSRGITPWGDIVPDIVMPGVWVYAHTTGFMDMIDKTVSGFSPASGTSMSAPAATGLITLMREAHRRLLGKTLTLDEILLMMSELSPVKEKSPDYGWGVLTWSIYEEWLSTQYGVRI